MERKEPTFYGSSLGPTETNVRQPSESMTEPQRAMSSRTVSTPPKSSSPVAAFALLLVVVSLAASGFIYSQLQESQVALAVAAAKIYKLEQQLSLSDDESTQSVASLQAVMKKQQVELTSANSEIRKLWDTRNVNKKAIAVNNKTTAATNSALKKVEPVIASVKKLIVDSTAQTKKIARLL